MAVTDVQLQSGTKARLVFLQRTSQGSTALNYLHSVKSKVVEVEGTYMEQSYHTSVLRFASELAGEVANLGPFDALLNPPTGRPDLVAPYSAAIRAKFTGVPDLSGIIRRDPGGSAGRAEDYAQVRCALHIADPVRDLTFVSRLLIIDDVYGRGFTASAIHELLVSAGWICGGLVIACPLVADGFPGH